MTTRDGTGQSPTLGSRIAPMDSFRGTGSLERAPKPGDGMPKTPVLDMELRRMLLGPERTPVTKKKSRPPVDNPNEYVTRTEAGPPPDRRFLSQDLPPVDELGRQLRPDPTQKDPFAQKAWGGMDIPPPVRTRAGVRGDLVVAEKAVEGALSPFMDQKTKFILSDKKLLPVLRELDNGDKDRYSVLLRKLKGSHPDFVKLATMAMPKARAAWSRSQWGKLKGTEEWIAQQEESLKGMTDGKALFQKKQEIARTKQALELAREATNASDDLASELAGNAAWYNRRGNKQAADAFMDQAKVWRGKVKVEPGSEDWFRAFNPRVFDKFERGGGSGLAVNVEGDLLPGPVGYLPPAPESLEKWQLPNPDEPRLPDHKAQFLADSVGEYQPGPFKTVPPSENYEPLPREAKPSTNRKKNKEGFKVAALKRSIENELILNGFQERLGGRAAVNAAVKIDPVLGQVLAGIYSVRGDTTVKEVAAKMANSPGGAVAADILEAMGDDYNQMPERFTDWATPNEVPKVVANKNRKALIRRRALRGVEMSRSRLEGLALLREMEEMTKDIRPEPPRPSGKVSPAKLAPVLGGGVPKRLPAIGPLEGPVLAAEGKVGTMLNRAAKLIRLL